MERLEDCTKPLALLTELVCEAVVRGAEDGVQGFGGTRRGTGDCSLAVSGEAAGSEGSGRGRCFGKVRGTASVTDSRSFNVLWAMRICFLNLSRALGFCAEGASGSGVLAACEVVLCAAQSVRREGPRAMASGR